MRLGMKRAQDRTAGASGFPLASLTAGRLGSRLSAVGEGCACANRGRRDGTRCETRWRGFCAHDSVFGKVRLILRL